MCGFAGEVSLRGPGAIGAALDAMRHRGPDDAGTWRDDLCVLGQRRLAIIDLSETGHQPMGHAASGVWLVVNGEIYNFQSLRDELASLGHAFRGTSDTEVLLHAYLQWGRECLHRLRGMFALAIWDPRVKRLLLARDRVGKKPLFWAEHSGRLRFASELQGLFAGSDLPRTPDLVAVDEYLSWGYVPPPRTGFAGVSKLGAGELLEVDLNGAAPVVRRDHWWSLRRSTDGPSSMREAGAAVREALTEAVRLRLISDVPVGAFLSGGVDSSIVVGLMAGLSSSPVRTYSIGFEEAAYDELPHARRIAERFGTEHHEVVVRPDAAAVLPMLVRHYGEPYADSSAIPTYYVSQVARTGVTVALNGDGGDESFAGYERYWAMATAERLRAVPGSHAAAAAMRRLLPDSLNPKSRLRRIRRFLEVATEPMSGRYQRWVGYFWEERKGELYGDALRPLLAGSRPTAWMERLFADVAGLHPAEQAMAVDVASYLPYDLLVKVDIASMACSLEGRSPFLDHVVMELAASLPTELKLHGRTSKRLLLEEFSDLLPRENVQRPKMGFGVPVGEWLRGSLRELARDALLGPELRARGLFDVAAVEHLLDDHLSRRVDATPQLWSLLMLELWYRELVDGPPADGD